MEKITLLHNMDDGYGAVYCIGKQTFLLNEIHDYLGIMMVSLRTQFLKV